MKRTAVCVSGVLTVLVAMATLPAAGKADPAPDKAALERTRKTVRMLDDIYKQTIVLITSKYVTKDSDYPAGRAAVKLFQGISANGWHDVRLLDATGKPYSDKNVAKDAFEKEGIRQLKAGQTYYEQIVEKDGKPFLRALTTVPVVMPKCVACHAHYADAKPGEAIGAISYMLAIE